MNTSKLEVLKENARANKQQEEYKMRNTDYNQTPERARVYSEPNK